MTERTHNMVGFALMPVALGGAIIVGICLSRKRRPSFWPVLGSLGCFSALGFAFWFIGVMMEMEYAYAFTLLRIPSAKSAAGVPISKIIMADDGYWFTDGYIADWCGDHDNLTVVRLGDSVTGWYFAYDSKTKVIVPMTDEAASRFPSLMPSGDMLVNVEQLNGHTNSYRSVGNFELMLPAKWFRSSIHAGPMSLMK